LRDSILGDLVSVYSTRLQARQERAEFARDSFDTFIWDTANNVATGPHPEKWDMDVDLNLGDEDEDEDEVVDGGEYTPLTDGDEDERWEIRDSKTAKLSYSFSSRKLAREYVSDEEFIWDTKLQKVEKGRVDVPNWQST